MQYATSLTAVGVFCLSLMAAMAAHWSSPELMLSQPMWPGDASLMRLQVMHLESTDHQAHQGHEHRSPGKPGADVALAGSAIYALTAGVPLDLELKLHSHLPRGSLHIRLQPSAELELLSATQEWNFALDGEQTLTLPITVRANSDGQHHGFIFVEHTDVDGNSSARALATEFRVGGGFTANLYEKHFSAAKHSEFKVLPAKEEIY
jgi:hypothetical protein